MNKRLKELAADAGYPDYMTYGQDKVLERFAELIVRECIDVVGRATASPTGYQALMEHFGVEL
jgi:hypothetical protein